ncbi:homeobox protein BarH-like 1 [Actinia tenebrosa]|uniref:Homeobox protein BarH-like 1 n=1 Tax=Actinia tenebrosa TaxID=6105 RepID=A0A6P8IKT4_ACTTE|nr:homeobox protein BarH-like 1 [Actinia tenebrosa]
MLFYGLYNINSKQLFPQTGLSSYSWPRQSAFKLPSKNGKRFKSFMIEDILSDKQETEDLLTSSSSSRISAFQPPRESLAVPSSVFPVFPVNFHNNMLQRPIPRTCNYGSTAHRKDTDNVPKCFRTILKESRKNRRNRTVFSRLQMQKLEEHFERKRYLSSQDRNDFAKSLSLTSLQVKTWYQNRRMKWKKEMLSIDPSAVTTRAKGRPRKGEF